MGFAHIEHPETTWILNPTQETFQRVWRPIREIRDHLVSMELAKLAESMSLTPKWDGSPAYHTTHSEELWYGKKPVDPESGLRFADWHGRQFIGDRNILPAGSIIECVVDDFTHQNVVQYHAFENPRVAVVPNKLFSGGYVNEHGWHVISGVQHWIETARGTKTNPADLWRLIGAIGEIEYHAKLLFETGKWNIEQDRREYNTRQWRMIKGIINRRFEAGIHDIPNDVRNECTQDILEWLIRHESSKLKTSRGRKHVHTDSHAVYGWLARTQEMSLIMEIADLIANAKDKLVEALDYIQAGYHHPVINPAGGKHEGWVWWESEETDPVKLVNRTWFTHSNREAHDHVR